jgi:hypothetical protein
MPVMTPRPPPTPNRRATLGPAVGRADDFYAFGYCPDLDELEREVDPDHGDFTYVLRYQNGQKTLVDRVKARLDGFWEPPALLPLLAVGEPNGILEVDPKGAREVALTPPPPGQFRALWGASDAHLFACGGFLQPFVLHRDHGHWTQLPLPAGTRPLNHVRGLKANEVYFAGEQGQLLLWDGKTLSALPVPTTRYLTQLAPLSPQVMCVVGYQGTLLMGNAQGWRQVPTQTEEALLSLAALDGKVYYGAEGVVWSFDGHSAPVVAIQTPARWVSGLHDALVLDDGQQSQLYRGGTLTPLDTTV